ncbi:MAG TPA: hypothetical protein VFJ16_29305 [Longimicrobium sp.]|nr:hypothetical protein [Longimicrobium sp.]
MRWLNGLLAGGRKNEDGLEERLRQPERWPGDRLAPLLLACGSGRPGRAKSAAAELRGTLERIPPAQLVGVDQRVRAELWSSTPYPVRDWVRTPAAVDHLRQRVGDDVAVLCVLSTHPSGYVREAAVKALDEVGDGGFELPFLALRSYDWVPQVRQRAEAAALKRLTPANLPRVLDTMGLLLRTEERERSGPVGRRAVELLRDPAARPLLRQGLHSPDGLTRVFCFGWLVEDRAERPQLVLDAVASGDPVLRRAVGKIAGETPEARAVLVPVLLRDPSAHLRGVGVLLAATLDGAEPRLLAAATDPNATVRLFARKVLDDLFGRAIDAAWYRAALADAPESAGALAGLAEVGTAEDAEVLERYLAAPRVRLRMDAVKGYARLRRSDAVPALLRMLADPSPRVSRAAAAELRTLPVASSDLAPLYESGAAHVRRSVLRLLVRRGKWDALAWTLRACGDADPPIAEIGRGGLERWILRFNRSYAEPTMEQIARIRHALQASAPAIHALQRKRLMELLPQSMRATD